MSKTNNLLNRPLERIGQQTSIHMYADRIMSVIAAGMSLYNT